jgi:multiple sugar transport system permease protein
MANYRALLNRDLLEGIRLTLLYSVGAIGGEYLLGLGTALALNARFGGRTLARALIVFPWAIPTVVAVVVWLWMLNPDFGVVNYALIQLRVIRKPIKWISNPSTAMSAVIVTTIWKNYPIATLMLLAGLQTIPKQLYEAANIDGANRLQRFRHVTFPSLAAVNTILLILLLIWGIGKLVFILLMTQGGPAEATETLPMKIYVEAFKYFDLGKAVAIGVLLLAISLALTVLYGKLVYRTRREG